MRLVLDTNTIISSTLWDNSVSHKLLIELINKNVEIFTTTEILNEYKKVIIRDFDYSEEEADEIIRKLVSFIKIIEPKTRVDIIKDDSEDNKILECAIESNSDFILSYDKHLLNVKQFQQIKIIIPEEFKTKFFK